MFNPSLAVSRPGGNRPLRQQFLHDRRPFDAGELLIEPLEFEREPIVRVLTQLRDRVEFILLTFKRRFFP